MPALKKAVASGTGGTVKKKKKFLALLASCGNVSNSCELAGLPRETAYRWKSKDRKFALDWVAALAMGADALEDEAVRRAKEGVDEPVYYKGAVVGQVRKYSDTLLMFLLNGTKPEKFKRNVQSGDSADRLNEIVEVMRAGPMPRGSVNEQT